MSSCTSDCPLYILLFFGPTSPVPMMVLVSSLKPSFSVFQVDDLLRTAVEVTRVEVVRRRVEVLLAIEAFFFFTSSAAAAASAFLS
jgi:hypothetical protein